MGIGVSIFLIAVGAVLTFAVTADVGGVSINTIGWIVMIVGAIGLVLAMIAMSTRRTERDEHVIVDRR